MTVYLYLMIWAVFWAFLSICFPLRDKLTNAAIRPNLSLAALSMLGLTVFAGLRSSGFDTDAYVAFFNKTVPSRMSQIGSADWSRDDGFLVLATIIKRFASSDFHYFLFIIAFITGIALFIGLYKRSVNYMLSMFLLFGTGIFSWFFNGMRQFMVAALLFALAPLIVKRKAVLYIIIAIILSTIHGSAIVLIPIYFIVQLKPWSKQVLFIFLGFIACAFFLNRLLPSLFILLENTQYGGYYQDVSTSGSMGVFRMVVALIPPLLAFLGRKTIEGKNDKLLNICVNMSLLSLGFYILSLAGGKIFFGRMTVYFELYNLILLPWLLKNLFTVKNRVMVYTLCVGCYLYYLYYQIVIAWNAYYTSDVLGLFWVR